MVKNIKLIVAVDQLHFKNGDDYLDVEINNEEGYMVLKTDSSGQFTLESVEQLDQIYNKLKEMFEQIKPSKAK
jgi:hypothetical protein